MGVVFVSPSINENVSVRSARRGLRRSGKENMSQEDCFYISPGGIELSGGAGKKWGGVLARNLSLSLSSFKGTVHFSLPRFVYINSLPSVFSAHSDTLRRRAFRLQLIN